MPHLPADQSQSYLTLLDTTFVWRQSGHFPGACSSNTAIDLVAGDFTNLFEEELAKNGLTSLNAEEAYRDPDFKFDDEETQGD